MSAHTACLECVHVLQYRQLVYCRCRERPVSKTAFFASHEKQQICDFDTLALQIRLLRWSQRLPRATTRLAHHREPGSKGVLGGRFGAESKIAQKWPKFGVSHVFKRRERNFDRPSWDQVAACVSSCGGSYPFTGDQNRMKTRRAVSKNVSKWSIFRSKSWRRFALERDLIEHAALGTNAP